MDKQVPTPTSSQKLRIVQSVSDKFFKVTFMFVIATSNEKFAARWMKVSGSSAG